MEKLATEETDFRETFNRLEKAFGFLGKDFSFSFRGDAVMVTDLEYESIFHSLHYSRFPDVGSSGENFHDAARRAIRLALSRRLWEIKCLKGCLVDSENKVKTLHKAMEIIDNEET